MKNPWKFESSQKLSSKKSNGSSSPVVYIKNDNFPQPTRSDLDSFAPQAEQKSPYRPRRSKGIAMKMKAKVQEQLRSVYRQLQQRESELVTITVEIDSLNQVLKQRKRAGQDLVNIQQMLLFKEKQLNNLMTIHAQLLESAKKDIQNEKSIKFSHDQKIVALKKRITDLNSRAVMRRHLKQDVEALIQEKSRLQDVLKAKRETQAKKKQIRSQAIRDLLQQLIKKNRREFQEQCQKKVRAVREATATLKNPAQLKSALARKSIIQSDYYTFGQLKYVQQLNFRTNPEAEKIMRLFYSQINPKIPEIIQHFEEPGQFIKLKEQLTNLEKVIAEKEAEVKKKQAQLQRLEQQKSKIKKQIGELKVKTQIK